MKQLLLAIISACAIFYGAQLYSVEPGWHVTILDNPAPGYIKHDWRTQNFNFFDNYGINQYSTPMDDIPRGIHKQLRNGWWMVLGSEKYYVLDKNLRTIDSIPFVPEFTADFHEMELLSNGNYLLLYQADTIMDLSAIIDNGSEKARVIRNVLIETDGTGEIYWQWNSDKHFKITDATSNIDLTKETIDMPHINAVWEDSGGGLIISCRHLDEITKISRVTGEIVWRMGGSECKNNQFRFLNDTVGGFFGFSHQHSPSRLENGNLLLFDNGNLKSPQYSRVVEYEVDEENKTVKKVWEYRNSPDVYANFMGNASRLPNGNTLINWAKDLITEVRPDKSKAFEMKFYHEIPPEDPLFAVYRAYKVLSFMNAATKNISSPGAYIFSDGDQNTGVTLDITTLSKGGILSVAKHDYRPPNADYADSDFAGILNARWVITPQASIGFSGKLRIKTSMIPGDFEPEYLAIYQRGKEASGMFRKLETFYNDEKNEISAEILEGGEFVVADYFIPEISLIHPTDGMNAAELSGSLLWGAAAGAQEYQAQISRSADFSEIVFDTLIVDTTAICKGLEYFRTYYWRVRASNSEYTSQWPAPYSFTTEHIPPPEITSPSDNFNGVHVNSYFKWEKQPAAQFYKVQVSESPDFTDLIMDSSGISTEELKADGLKYTTTYYWRAKSYNSYDTSKWGGPWVFTTTLPPPVLAFPENNAQGIPVDGVISWRKSAGANSYHIQISDGPYFNSNVMEGEFITDTAISYNKLNHGQLYYWRVAAVVNALNYSEWTAPWQFTTNGGIPQIEDISPPANICLGADKEILIKIGGISNGNLLQYQWFKDGAKITGANSDSATYTIENAAYESAGEYTCRVTNYPSRDTLFSGAIAIDVLDGPQILRQPENIYARIGSDVTITIDAIAPETVSGQEPHFRWYKGSLLLEDNEKYSGSSAKELTIKSFDLSDTPGNYRAEILNECNDGGWIATNTFDVLVSSLISAQPESQAKCLNETARLAASIESWAAEKSEYQWLRGGEILADDDNIRGSKTPELTIESLKKADSGEYLLLANYGSIIYDTSQIVSLIVYEEPEITKDLPNSIEITEGSEINLKIETRHEGSEIFEWQKGGSQIQKGPAPGLIIKNAGIDDEGNYKCIVTNECGSAESKEMFLKIGKMATGVVNPPQNEPSGRVLIAPNPMAESSRLIFDCPYDNEIEIRIYGIGGNYAGSVYTGQALQGRNYYIIDNTESRLAPGIYLLSITGKGFRFVELLLVTY